MFHNGYKFFVRRALTQRAQIYFVTDVEGHFPSFHKSVTRSNIVHFDSESRLAFHKNNSNPYFIFGGDLTDRGIADIRLIEMLLDFKRRHPERVFLIIGNREAAKTRFYIELNPAHIRERLLRGSAPFWLLAGPHQLPIDYVKKHMEIKGLTTENLKKIEDYIQSLSIEECQLIYLKWMLEQNMGCPHTFEYHRQHLAAQRACSVAEIPESLVLKNIIDESAPSGLIGQYILQTQMAVIIPETGILALHGGLTPENIGRLPTMAPDASPIDDAHTWIKQINGWYSSALSRWSTAKQEQMPLELHPARGALDTFSERVPSTYRSIVTASMLDNRRQFQQVHHYVSEYLRKSQIEIVLTGHQPCGDHPAILRSGDDSLLFVNGDISYADTGTTNAHDTRGLAWHTTEIDVHDAITQLNVVANLSTGERVKNQITLSEGKITDCHHLGRLLPDGELIQCKLGESGYYRTVRQNGFTVNYRQRSAAEISMILENERLSATDVLTQNCNY